MIKKTRIYVNKNCGGELGLSECLSSTRRKFTTLSVGGCTVQCVSFNRASHITQFVLRVLPYFYMTEHSQ